MEELHVEGHKAVDIEAAEIEAAEPIEACRKALEASEAAIAARQAAIDEADRAAERADELVRAVAAGEVTGDLAILTRRAAEERITVEAMQRRAADLRARAIPEAETRAAAAKLEADRFIEGRLRRLVGSWAERLGPEYRRIVGAAEIIDAGVHAIARQHDVKLPANFPKVLSAAQERNK